MGGEASVTIAGGQDSTSYYSLCSERGWNVHNDSQPKTKWTSQTSKTSGMNADVFEDKVYY